MFGADNCVRSGIHDGAVLLDPPPLPSLSISEKCVLPSPCRGSGPEPSEDQRATVPPPGVQPGRPAPSPASVSAGLGCGR